MSKVLAAVPASGYAVQVSNLEKKFGTFTAVTGLSFTIDRGEIFGLLGPNGSGKTTTLNMISGLSEPTSGTVEVFGMDPKRQSTAVRRLLGVVPQETALYEELTAERNLSFHAELFGFSGNEKKRRVARMLELAQLTDRAKSRAGTFSGGMKRRLALVRAMLHEPWLMYLDEPTLGVDVQSRNVIWEYIRHMKTEGRSVLLTTNYLEEVNALCDRIAVIDHGKLVAMDTPASLKSRYGNSVVEMDVDESISDSLVEKIRLLKEVQSVDRHETNLRITLRSGADLDPSSILPRLLEKMSQQGLGVLHMSLREPSLEEVFLALTGRGLRD
ncbi:MAG: ABC transporter ATP-binding protein [Bacilli bacterium]